MNQKLQYFFMLFLSIGIIIVSIQKCGTVEKIIVKEVADTNVIYDHISDEFQAKKIIWLDSIDKLNARAKVAKSNYKKSYSNFHAETKIVVKEDSNCIITLNYANIYINSLDSILQIKSIGLENCLAENKMLDNQVKYNKASASTLLLENVKLKNALEKQKRKRKGCIRFF